MNNIAVIYKSKYGTTKKYAQWIAEELEAHLFEVSAINPTQLESFDTVIYGGGLYAGGIGGIELVTKHPCKRLVVFTVGLADPNTTDYSTILNKNFTKDLLLKIKVFHLRGGVDYKKLGPVHKGMMSMRRMMINQKDKTELTEENKAFLDTYGDQVDFVDRATIRELIKFMKEKEKQ